MSAASASLACSFHVYERPLAGVVNGPLRPRTGLQGDSQQEQALDRRKKQDNQCSPGVRLTWSYLSPGGTSMGVPGLNCCQLILGLASRSFGSVTPYVA